MTTRSLRSLLTLLLTFGLLAVACGSDADDAAPVEAETSSEAVDASASDDDTSDDDDAMDDEEAMAEAEEEAEEAMEDEAEAAAAEDPEDAMDHDAMDDEAMADDDMDDDAMEDEAMADEAMADAPQRIVSISPTGTEMLFAVGAGDQVIAVDNFSYYPPEAPVIDDLSAFTPSVEAIAAFEPDLIVISNPVEGLDALGVEILELPAAVTLDDIYAEIEQVGAATGHVGEAAELVLQMQTDIDATIAALPARETPLTYYHELDPTYFSVTSQTFIGYVYNLLGLENAADAADPDGEAFGYPQLNQEYLFEANPDLIFLADTICCAQNATTVGERAGWDQLRAVQNGNVIELNDDIASRWGPRIVEFIQTAGAAVASVDAVPAG